MISKTPKRTYADLDLDLNIPEDVRDIYTHVDDNSDLDLDLSETTTKETLPVETDSNSEPVTENGIELQPETTTDAPEEGAEAQPVGIELSDEQEEFIREVLSDNSANVLLLGKAGVGKSTTTKTLCRRADELHIPYTILAPTGVAAINVGGMTVHRFIADLSRREDRTPFRFILVDEVSMCRADLMDQLSGALERFMFSSDPFGGIKMVFVGDPAQLPPVMKKDDPESEYVKDNYTTPYFFSSVAYANSVDRTRVMELTKVFRQKDERYPKMLNLVREGKWEKPVSYLNQFRKTREAKGVILTSTNKDADATNSAQLAKLDGFPQKYQAIIQGDIRNNEYPAEYVLNLKVGARVMVIKNIYDAPEEDFDGKPIWGTGALELVNGDVGTVTELQKNCVTIQCDRTGREHVIEQHVWEKTEATYNKEEKKLTREVVGQFIQVPLRLAWAITIHKSQGATIEELTIDLRRPLFAEGQAYVALSRGVSLERLWILGEVRARDIIVSPHVKAFLTAEPLYRSGVKIKPGSAFDGTQTDLFAGEKKKKSSPTSVPAMTPEEREEKEKGFSF